MIDADAGRWIDPEVAFLALADDGREVVWLDSGPAADTGMSLIGWPAPDGPRLLAGAGDAAAGLARLREALAEPRPGLLPAWSGWFGHEFGAALLGVSEDGASGSGGPAVGTVRAEAVLVERAILFDHAHRRVRVLVADGDGDWAAELLQVLRGLPAVASAPPSAPLLGAATRAHDDREYLELIRACQDRIRAGDAYQLCLTERWLAPRPGDATAVYRRLRRLAPSHHGGLLRLGGRELLSASPERFLELRPDRTVVTRPMKGTRPRRREPRADREQAAELLASEKERAENLMIVDLMRNDLSRVCEPGSVTVESLFAVESYRSVHQLVSTVTGRLRPGLGAVDAFAALFPPGSMTGAPKRRATELLGELEGVPRGPYAGAFGYFAADGTADLATTIRTIVLDGETAAFGTGGGITAGSDPAAELAEMKLKAGALLEALGATG